MTRPARTQQHPTETVRSASQASAPPHTPFLGRQDPCRRHCLARGGGWRAHALDELEHLALFKQLDAEGVREQGGITSLEDTLECPPLGGVAASTSVEHEEVVEQPNVTTTWLVSSQVEPHRTVKEVDAHVLQTHAHRVCLANSLRGRIRHVRHNPEKDQGHAGPIRGRTSQTVSHGSVMHLDTLAWMVIAASLTSPTLLMVSASVRPVTYA